MIITISGSAGSGKSTLAKMLAKRMNYTHYSMGDMRRKMAQDRNMTLAEFNALGEKEDFTDKEVDAYQKELGEKEDNFIIDGRLSFHFIPHSIKFYIDANSDTRAQRVLQGNRAVERFTTVEEAKVANENRHKSDTVRYKQYYGLEWDKPENYDYVVDTTHMDPEEAIEKMIQLIEAHK